MSKELINETKCPVCKRVFAYTPMWVYKRNKTFLCTYTCTKEYDRLHSKRQHMSNGVRNEKIKKLVAMFDAGCNTREISETLGMNMRSVRYYYHKIIA